MTRRFLHNDSGTTALEFALILPVLLAFLGCIAEYGLVVFTENSVRAVIDEAARNAVVRKWSQPTLYSTVDDSLKDMKTLDSYTLSASTGCTVTISVTGNHNTLFKHFLTKEMVDTFSFTLTARYPNC